MIISNFGTNISHISPQELRELFTVVLLQLMLWSFGGFSSGEGMVMIRSTADSTAIPSSSHSAVLTLTTVHTLKTQYTLSLPNIHPHYSVHTLTTQYTPSLLSTHSHLTTQYTPSLPKRLPHKLSTHSHHSVHTLATQYTPSQTQYTLSPLSTHPHYSVHNLTNQNTPSQLSTHPHYSVHTLTTQYTLSLPNTHPPYPMHTSLLSKHSHITTQFTPSLDHKALYNTPSIHSIRYSEKEVYIV
jgi:hypothetical protein